MLDTEPLLDAEYIETGLVRYIVYPYHLGRPEYALATEAAWCAADQDKFFDFQNALYQNFGLTINPSTLTDLAAQVGLNSNVFSQCLSNRTHQGDVESARQAAAKQGVNSTPIFFINKQRIEGNQPYEVFQKIIEQELAITQ